MRKLFRKSECEENDWVTGCMLRKEVRRTGLETWASSEGLQLGRSIGFGKYK